MGKNLPKNHSWNMKKSRTLTKDGEMSGRDLDPAGAELTGLADPLALRQMDCFTALLHLFQRSERSFVIHLWGDLSYSFHDCEQGRFRYRI
jgi:hypothetical protein